MMLTRFHDEVVIHSERRLYNVYGKEETRELVPHLRADKKENDHMYLCTDLIEVILHHCLSELKQPHYHWTRRDVIWISFFKNDSPEMLYFQQCELHRHFCKSTVGAKPDGLLKITMNPNSPHLEVADWRFVIPLV